MFTERELANAEHCGGASRVFLLRVAEEIEMRAITLATGHRKAVVQAQHFSGFIGANPSRLKAGHSQ